MYISHRGEGRGRVCGRLESAAAEVGRVLGFEHHGGHVFAGVGAAFEVGGDLWGRERGEGEMDGVQGQGGEGAWRGREW